MKACPHPFPARHILHIFCTRPQKAVENSLLNYCKYWRPVGDSNPCYRCERAKRRFEEVCTEDNQMSSWRETPKTRSDRMAVLGEKCRGNKRSRTEHGQFAQVCG